MLNNMDIRTHNGRGFQSNTINRILKNRTYCGYYISGKLISPHLPHLQIIDEETFEKAQKIITQRSVKSKEKTQIVNNTKAKTLLSGNIYCAHCGSRVTSTSYADKYTRVDGSIYEVRRQRYMCSNKAQSCDLCDGPSGYVSNRIDRAVEMIVCEYFSRIKTATQSNALEKRYQTKIVEMKLQKRDIEKEIQDWKELLSQLYTEIPKVLTGESKYTQDMLSCDIEKAKTELQMSEDRMAQLNNSLNDCKDSLKKLNHQYEQLRGWAEVYKDATFTERKMIIFHLIQEIRVSRGYELDVVVDMNYEQFMSK